MALKWQALPGTNFDNTLFNALKVLEGPAPGKGDLLHLISVNKNPTIGVGFDLATIATTEKNAVLIAMGLNSKVVALKDSPRAGTPELIEYQYIAALRAEMRKGGSLSALNDIMKARAENTDSNFIALLGNVPRRQSFAFNNETEVRDVYNNVLPSYIKQITDKYTFLRGDAAFGTSREKLVLADFTWNGGGGLLGNKLQAALISGNRAEAWFEIRYDSNGGESEGPGLAKRRFFDAQLFGLYDNPNTVSFAEAKTIYQSISYNRKKIDTYESQFGYNPNGQTATSLSGTLNPITAATSDYQSLINAGIVTPAQNLVDALQPAETAFVSQLATMYASETELANSLNVTAFSGGKTANIYVAKDENQTLSVLPYQTHNFKNGTTNLLVGGAKNGTLIGGAGTDILIGGDGDTLRGGTGNETLIGGVGNETLIGNKKGHNTFVYVGKGTGIEHITTANADDKLFANGHQLGEATTLVKGKANTFVDNFDQTTQYQYDPTAHTLTVTNGLLGSQGGKVIIDDFDINEAGNNPAGFLGIHLAKQLALSTTNNPFGGMNAAPGVTLGTSSGPKTVALAFADNSVTLTDGMSAAPDLTLDTSGRTQTVTIYSSVTSTTEQTVTLTLLNGDASQFMIINDHASLAFADNSVTLSIPAGQDQTTISLSYTGKSVDSKTVELQTAFADPAGTATPSNTLMLTFENTTVQPEFKTTSTIFGHDGLKVNGIATTYYTGNNGSNLIMTDNGQNYINTRGVANLDTEPDAITAGTGKDTLEGGNGNTIVAGGGGADLLLLGNGKNQLFAGQVVELGTALTKQNELAAVNQQGTLFAVGNGDNTIVGGTGHDLILLGSGNNTVVTGPGDTIVFGGVNVDIASVYDDYTATTSPDHSKLDFTGLRVDSTGFTPGANYQGTSISSPDRPPQIVGTGNNTIYAGKGNDSLYLANGNNFADGGQGDDFIQAGAGNSTIYGGAGNDTIRGAGGNNVIDGGDGADLIVAQGGNSTIYGGGGNDTLVAGDDGDHFAMSETQGHHYIQAGNGDMVLIYGSGGNDTLIGGSGHDILYAGDGIQALYAGSGDTMLLGGAGMDTLIGGSGRDTIIAGSGDTLLRGGGGIDLIRGGSGKTIIYADDGGTDQEYTEVQAGSGETTIYGGNGANLIFGGAGTNVIYAGDGGTAVSATEIQAGSGATTVVGGSGIDHIFGGAGSNVLYAGDGGTGDAATQVIAGSGNTTIYGGAGVDELFGGSGDNVLYAGNGGNSDQPSQLIGGSGNNTLVGGAGSAYLVGGTGHNTFIIPGNAGNITLVNVNGSDSIQFGDGISAADFDVSQNSGTLAALMQTSMPDNPSLKSGTDAGLALKKSPLSPADNISLSALTTTGSTSVSSVTLADNTTGMDPATLEGISATDLTLYIGNQSITIQNGLLGGIAGGLTFTDGTTLSRSDILALAPALTIVGGNGNDNILGSIHNDTISGGNGNDTIAAGRGNDQIAGGNGNDTYFFNLGDGIDQIDNSALDNASATDTLQLGAGIAGNDLGFTRNGDNLIVNIGSSGTMGDSITLQNYFSATADNKIDQIRFANNTVWNRARIEQSIMLQSATANDDFINGFSGNDITHGLDGNDQINGNAGSDQLFGDNGNDNIDGGADNDTLSGGQGIDYLSGGLGSDTFLFGRGDGHDTINEASKAASDIDTLVFGSDIQPADIKFKRDYDAGGNPNDLLVYIDLGNGNFNDGVTVAGHFARSDNVNKIDQFKFADGTVLGFADIQRMVTSISNGNDTILGYNFDDNIDGLGGDDAIFGFAGNDTLHGGAGNDSIDGGTGNNQLLGDAGNDTLQGGNSNDTLDGGTGKDQLMGGGRQRHLCLWPWLRE